MVTLHAPQAAELAAAPAAFKAVNNWRNFGYINGISMTVAALIREKSIKTAVLK